MGDTAAGIREPPRLGDRGGREGSGEGLRQCLEDRAERRPRQKARREDAVTVVHSARDHGVRAVPDTVADTRPEKSQINVRQVGTLTKTITITTTTIIICPK